MWEEVKGGRREERGGVVGGIPSAETLKATKEEREDAQVALTKFDELTETGTREKFLKMFEDNGGGKNGLKFSYTFTGIIEHKEDTTTATLGKYCSVGQILWMFGRTLKDFDTMAEAVADVVLLVKKNQEDNMWDEEMHPSSINLERPEYSSYWFHQDEGKRVSLTQQETKRIEGTAEIKTPKALENVVGAMEILGYKPPEDDSTVTITNVKYETLMKEVALLLLTYLVR